MTPGNDEPDAPPRQKNSATTKDALKRAALAAFTRSGYDGVGLREISREAGVDPRLVGRYFGSKADLFAETLGLTTTSQPLVPPITEDAAAELLTQPRTPGYLDGYLMTIRSTSNDQAVKILRAIIERNGEAPLAELLTGPHRNGRAALLIAISMGVLLMRDIIGTPSLNDDETTELVPYLDAILRILAAPPEENGPNPPR